MTLEELEEALRQVEGDRSVAPWYGGYLELWSLLSFLGLPNPAHTLLKLRQFHPPLRVAVEQRRFPKSRRKYPALKGEDISILLDAFRNAPACLPVLAATPMTREPAISAPGPPSGPRPVPSPQPVQGQLALISVAPFGWCWTDRPVPIPEEARAIRRIKQERVFKTHDKDIAAKLNQEGQLLRGRLWTPEDIQEVLDRDEIVREKRDKIERMEKKRRK